MTDDKPLMTRWYNKDCRPWLQANRLLFETRQYDVYSRHPLILDYTRIPSPSSCFYALISSFFLHDLVPKNSHRYLGVGKRISSTQIMFVSHERFALKALLTRLEAQRMSSILIESIIDLCEDTVRWKNYIYSRESILNMYIKGFLLPAYFDDEMENVCIIHKGMKPTRMNRMLFEAGIDSILNDIDLMVKNEHKEKAQDSDSSYSEMAEW